MTELVFSVKDIFNTSNQNGCLSQYDCTRYHIPAYQRGYKWGSERNGAVTILLNDLWSAFEAYQKKERKEYYLQYITVKKADVEVNGLNKNYLEVIDGQQRLTTLSVILSALSALLDDGNISTDKLDYAIRENFFSNHIYRKGDFEKLVNKTWEEVASEPHLNKQDIYYLYSAAEKAYKFFYEKDIEELEDFYEYLQHYVKVIVNSVERHVQSETVFKNLNSNKVPLTEADLIKGLLITKVGRANFKGGTTHFREALEIRSNLGRHWDVVNNWANQPEIESFYFNNSKGMHQLLTLVAYCLENNDNKLDRTASEKDFPLFNFFHKYSDYSAIYQKLKDVQATLQDWYQNDETYNLIGFCRFAKNSKSTSLIFLKACLKMKDKQSLKKNLNKAKNILLPQSNISGLRYGEDNNAIHNILLALNVFESGQDVRFNFHAFIDKSWTLEHVFPQSPEGKNNILSAEEKAAIKEILKDTISPEVEAILDKDVRSDQEKEIYYKALQESSFLNSIGNMCLLTNTDNISNGCLSFKEKRENILKLIQKGSFVPSHTFSVFSKMIPGLKADNFKMWYRSDIENHTKHISQIFENKQVTA